MLIDILSKKITGRSEDLFSPDIQERFLDLGARIGGSRVLVVGGAGSIGSSTVKAFAKFNPRTLHVVDQNENNLAELVRDLRSDQDSFEIPDFKAIPIDFGSPIMQRFLLDSGNYDFVLNFAAIKHVRSEKDVCSLLQLLDTNIVKAERFIQWLKYSNFSGRYFCVSTDKAANPVNLMGASKRMMEHLIFSDNVASVGNFMVTSARFANVAFSEGSILDSFIHRIQKRQPLSVPKNTRRYFITLREAGQICMLAAVFGENRHVFVPKLDIERDLIDLQSIASEVIGGHGFVPAYYDTESETKAKLMMDLASGRYPVLLTSLDTSGEKPYEEFVGDDETAVEIGMKSLLGVRYLPAPKGSLENAIREIQDLINSPRRNIKKDEIISLIATVVPHLRHVETGKNLDNRM